MKNRNTMHSSRFSRFSLCALAGVLVFALSPVADAQSAYVRVNQVGYETGNGPFQAYLMSTVQEPSDVTWTFSVFSVNNSQEPAYFGPIGNPIGTGKWRNSSTLTYYVYPLSFTVPGGAVYYISVTDPATAKSPSFAVNTPGMLYPGLLLNTLWFYETDEDGPGYTQNALRTAPGHLNDANATVYNTPPIADNNQDNVDNAPPALPLVSAQLPTIDAEGGWWDAGDYMKYVETTSYTVALMEIGIRDFPKQMGPRAPCCTPSNPPAPPASVSYAGNASGAPMSSDFDASAQFGINWLAEMWDDSTKTLYYQVDNSQDWDYYGFGSSAKITSDTGICGLSGKLGTKPNEYGGGGTYPTPYCLINEYDIWTLPQAADNFALTELFPQKDSSKAPYLNQPCDQYSTYYICFRPVFLAAAADSPISPNLAGRMAAAFAEYYQLYANAPSSFCQLPTGYVCLDPNLALLYAEDIFALANTTSLADPALGEWPKDDPNDNGTCLSGCLTTAIPFNNYPETVWDDDMEFGATELYIALQIACPSQPCENSQLPVTTPLTYLTDAAQRAHDYITKIYTNAEMADTLNLYDVSGLAHFELYRALGLDGNPTGLAENQATILAALDDEMSKFAIKHAQHDVWGFGFPWGNESVTNLSNGDVTSHGAGLSVMASELYYLCLQSGNTCLNPPSTYNTYSQWWLANILGANAWGSSFIVGDGSTFPNCIQHQVANLVGALNGTSAGVPILWGAAVEGPTEPTSGAPPGMNLCSTTFEVNGTEETFAIFNGPDGAQYLDNVQSYSNTEPGIDLTATSFLMFAWRMAGSPSSLP